MPNREPRARRPPTCLWAVKIKDQRALEGAIQQSDERYEVLIIEFNRAAPLDRLVRDFRTLVTEVRYSLLPLDDLADEFRVERVVDLLRKPQIRAAMNARARAGFSDKDILAALNEVPWPSARRVLRMLGGPPWTLHRVKKLLRVVKENTKLAVAMTTEKIHRSV
jgi:hypothetical protein